MANTEALPSRKLGVRVCNISSKGLAFHLRSKGSVELAHDIRCEGGGVVSRRGSVSGKNMLATWPRDCAAHFNVHRGQMSVSMTHVYRILLPLNMPSD